MVTDFWYESAKIGIPYLHSVRFKFFHVERCGMPIFADVHLATIEISYADSLKTPLK